MTCSLRYAARVKRDSDGTYLVSFPDLPEALTSGATLNEALSEAEDCLDAALATRLLRREKIPAPTPARRGHRLVSVPLYLAPKIALWMAMSDQQTDEQGLGRLLGTNKTAVRQLLSPKSETTPEVIQKALAMLGRTVVLTTEDAA